MSVYDFVCECCITDLFVVTDHRNVHRNCTLPLRWLRTTVTCTVTCTVTALCRYGEQTPVTCTVLHVAARTRPAARVAYEPSRARRVSRPAARVARHYTGGVVLRTGITDLFVVTDHRNVHRNVHRNCTLPLR